ncbi:hypothetical protein BU25DRAFT_161857 [Macroventuria anomochaeta]|uniref:Uncharacterized protein n=1 Tax=Macroventuria anomochaeta TaxID=301207 RepID=A0ACB6RQX9_9PLEO|nr:uncharacterized protein BU25DRAFT_161857 [Macroventuria anomochaeta]KAF2624122.1 hypothetical protein BU25DRAFT_161857 [Macroventuria anomochaeta]
MRSSGGIVEGSQMSTKSTFVILTWLAANNNPPSHTSWNLMEPHGIPWNIMESHGTSWNIMEPHGTSWNLIYQPTCRGPTSTTINRTPRTVTTATE